MNSLKARSLIFKHLKKEWVTIKKIEEIYDTIYIHLTSDHPPNPSIILNEIKDSEERGFLSGLLFDLENIEDTIAVMMAKECLVRLEEHYLKNGRNILREKLKTSDKINEIIKKITHIENNLKNINTKYDEIDKNI